MDRKELLNHLLYDSLILTPEEARGYAGRGFVPQKGRIYVKGEDGEFYTVEDTDMGVMMFIDNYIRQVRREAYQKGKTVAMRALKKSIDTIEEGDIYG